MDDAAGLPASFTGSHWFARSSRAFLAARSRYAEDGLRVAVDRHVHQYVILGSGLDTCRLPEPIRRERARLRGRISGHATLEAGPAPSGGYRDSSPADLRARGLRGLQRRGRTLRRRLPACSTRLLFVAGRHDLPAALDGADDAAADRAEWGRVRLRRLAVAAENGVERLVFDALATRVAEAGEPWITLFDPAELTAELLAAGFSAAEHRDGAGINARYLGGRQDGFTVGTLARLVNAVRS